MADILIQSLSVTAPARIGAEIERGWATVRLPASGEDELAIVTVKPFDAGSDLLFAIPLGVSMTRALLEAELDLHVPPILSRQTKMHWVASAVGGYVMIQPVDTHANLSSPLAALCSLMQCAQEDEGILMIESGGMLLGQLLLGVIRITAIPYDASVLLNPDSNRFEGVKQLSESRRLILVGAEVSGELVEQLNRIEPHRYAAISQPQLFACATLDPAMAAAIGGYEAAYALPIGVASALSSGDGALIVVR